MSRAFSTKSGSLESLKFSCRCGFSPDARQMRTMAFCVIPFGFGHRARAPVRRPHRFFFQRARDDRLDLGVGELARLSRPWRIAQAGQPLRQEALPPLPNCRQCYFVPLSHCRVTHPARAIQHDVRAQCRALMRLWPPGHHRELRSFVRT